MHIECKQVRSLAAGLIPLLAHTGIIGHLGFPVTQCSLGVLTMCWSRGWGL